MLGSDVSGKGSHHLPRVQLGPAVPRGTDPEPSVVRPLLGRGQQRRPAPLPPVLGGLLRFLLYPDRHGKEEGRGEAIR